MLSWFIIIPIIVTSLNQSTETALVRVISDLLLFGDLCNCSVILLLDLSSAFDTVCHKLLLVHLSEFGMSEDALSWFSAYLTDRQYYITSMHNYTYPTVLLKRCSTGLRSLPIIVYYLHYGSWTNYSPPCFQYHCYVNGIQIYIACWTDTIHQPASFTIIMYQWAKDLAKL